MAAAAAVVVVESCQAFVWSATEGGAALLHNATLELVSLGASVNAGPQVLDQVKLPLMS